MTMQRIIRIIVCLILCLSTMGTALPSIAQEAIRQQDESPSFPFPDIPVSLQTPASRLDYLLRHYWEKFDFNDRTQLENPQLGEQGFVNFIALMTNSHVHEELAEAAMEAFCKQMIPSDNGRKTFTTLAKEYLYHADSPMYNERLYALFLRTMLKSPTIKEAERQRMTFRLRLIERNQPGEMATNFSYLLLNGKQCTLNQTEIKGDYLIVFFYDPECSQCHQTLTEMRADPQLSTAIKKGRLSLLAIYTEDNPQVWRNTLSEIPDGWITGDNRSEIKEKLLYDLKAMPSLYLLDKEKKVILKDTSYKEIKRVANY